MLCMSHTVLVTELELCSPPPSVQRAMLEMGYCVQLIVTGMATLILICPTSTTVSQTPRTSSASRSDMNPSPRSHVTVTCYRTHAHTSTILTNHAID